MSIQGYHEVDFDIWSEGDVEVFDSREDWLAARTSMFGASESASLFGCGYADQNANSVIASKITGHIDEAETKRLLVGRIMEPSLKELFTLETGMQCLPMAQWSIVRNRELPWLGASLDAVTLDRERGLCPVELKHVDGFNLWEWRDGNGPLKFQVQCQHQMAVTGATRAYLFGVVGSSNLVSIAIERNQRFIEAMLQRLKAFWGYVERREIPEVDGSEATTRALRLLHPDDLGGTANLPSEAIEWASELEKAKADEEDAQNRSRLASNKLKAAIADNTFGELPDGTKFSLKTQERPAYVCKQSKFRVLRRVK